MERSIDYLSVPYRTSTMKRREFLASVLPVSLLAVAACSKKNRVLPLGVCDWTAKLVGNPSVMDFAKSIGLDGVQISSNLPSLKIPYLTDSEIDAYRDKMSSTGISICSIGLSGMNAHPFYAVAEGVDYLKSAIDAAVKLDCKNILLPFYGPANMLKKGTTRLDESLFAPLVKKLRVVAPYAEDAGVNVSLENSLSCFDNVRILESTGSPNINIYFDVMNFEYYGHTDTPSCLRSLKRRIGQIHLKSSYHLLNTGKGYPSDMTGCLQAIKDIGYRGWLVFESHEFTPSNKFGISELLKSNMEFVKSSLLYL